MANPLLDINLIRTMAFDKNEHGYYRILSQVEIEYVTPEEVEQHVLKAYKFYAKRPSTSESYQYVWGMLQKAMNNYSTSGT